MGEDEAADNQQVFAGILQNLALRAEKHQNLAVEQGNQSGDDKADDAAEQQGKGGNHRGAFPLLGAEALGNQDGGRTRDDAEHQIADGDDLIGCADRTGCNIVVAAQDKDVDKAEQHEQDIFNQDGPGQTKQIHSLVHGNDSSFDDFLSHRFLHS